MNKRIRSFKLLFLLIGFLLHIKLSAQVYVFQNENKLIKQKKADKWLSTLKYNNFEFEWCDKYPKTDSCFNIEKQYKYQLTHDTIFLISLNNNYKFKKHPQYSLNMKDTLVFLEENSEGLKNGSTIGNTVYLKDTTIKVHKLLFECYVFLRFTNHRNTTGENEYIYLDKKSLIPIISNTYYIDLRKNAVIKTAFKKRTLQTKILQ